MKMNQIIKKMYYMKKNLLYKKKFNVTFENTFFLWVRFNQRNGSPQFDLKDPISVQIKNIEEARKLKV